MRVVRWARALVLLPVAMATAAWRPSRRGPGQAAWAVRYIPWPMWSQLTLGFMSVKVPLGFSFHAQTCSS